jgi:hypothetical protein
VPSVRSLRSGRLLACWSTSRGTTGCPFCCNRAARPQENGAVLPPDHGCLICQQVLLRLGGYLHHNSDAYHLSLWAGCGGELRPVKRPVIVSNGPGQPSEVSWVDALVNGCTPSTCRRGCDKDLSGIMIDGFVFRFAACQFGQKTAGSLLGSIVWAVARFFARLPDTCM